LSDDGKLEHAGHLDGQSFRPPSCALRAATGQKEYDDSTDFNFLTYRPNSTVLYLYTARIHFPYSGQPLLHAL